MNAPSELRCLKTDHPCGEGAEPCPCLNCQVYAQFNTHFSGTESGPKNAPYDGPKDTEPEWWEQPGGSL